LRHNFINKIERINNGIYAAIPQTKEPITIVLLNFVKATKGISSKLEKKPVRAGKVRILYPTASKTESKVHAKAEPKPIIIA